MGGGEDMQSGRHSSLHKFVKNYCNGGAAFFACGVFYLRRFLPTLLRKFLDISGHEPTPLVRNEPMQITLQMGGGGFDPELIIYN